MPPSSRSSRRVSAVGAIAVLLGSAPLAAQAIAGTYSTANQQGGTITLVLRPAPGGKVAGTLSGNGNTFQIDGTMGDDAAEGTITGNGLKMFFAARTQGQDLQFAMAEPDASGQPDYAKATQISFRREAGVGTPASPAGAGGNPLSAGRAATSDRYAGAWTSRDMSLSLSGAGGAYSGTLTHQGMSYPVTLRDEGPGLSGTFTAQGTPYELLVKVENGMLQINTAGTTYMLARGSAGSAGPLTAGAGGGARSPQDEQMIAVLTKNAWCSFSYSGSSGTYSTGGSTRTGRVVLYPDGSATMGSKSELTSSGAAGVGGVYGSSGQRGFWKYENGIFSSGPSRQQMTPQQFKMTFNSNGYPIPIIDGTEYMICR